MLSPELRWAVLRAAVAAKAVPKGCLGPLAYLLAVAPEHIKTEELTEALGINKGSLRARLRLLEATGFIRMRLSNHGKLLELLVPPSLEAATAQTVKVSQNDTSFSGQATGAQVAKIGPPGGLRLPNEGHLENQVAKIGPPGKEQVAKIGPPKIQVAKIGLPETGAFLRGMLEALEDGSKPGNMNPECTDNNGIESP